MENNGTLEWLEDSFALVGSRARHLALCQMQEVEGGEEKNEEKEARLGKYWRDIWHGCWRNIDENCVF